MRIYSILFDRINRVAGKGAGPEVDGAFFSSLMFGLLIWMDFSIIYILFRYYFHFDILIKTEYLILIGIQILGMNIYYFLSKKRYLIIKEQVNSMPKNRRTLYSWATFLYVFLTILTFYLLVAIKIHR